MKRTGILFALISAVLFGISPVLVKMIMGEMSPFLLAGLLYLGSGAGLHLILIIQRQSLFKELKGLGRSDYFRLGGAVVAGGILAPLFLVYGIRLGTAFEVSLLLNLETVATTIIAWLIFHEHVGRHVWVGKLLLVLGGIIIAYDPANPSGLSWASILIFTACICWGIDNNLTRDLEDISPSALASIKGWVAGVFNLALAIAAGQSAGGATQVLGTLLIGAFSYGVSLVLFVKALRAIGTARTSTWFAAGPFFGMVLAVLLLHEQPAVNQWIAALLMITGLWTLSRERHIHPHNHETILHRHKHEKDTHHQHGHNGSEGPEPHDHSHVHDEITHAHMHWPDIHHRHSH